jgi:protocatechuate 3,4-dioxygenase alpha subunit
MSGPPRLLTASQTVGPFFHDCLLRADARRSILAAPGTPGQRIRITGSVIDGEGRGVPDAMVEIWQADSRGRYRGHGPVDQEDGDPMFLGFGRTGTNEQGVYGFDTIKPGPVAFDAGRAQAPHVSVAVFGRGLLNHLFTRIYFADEPSTGADPLLALVPPARRQTLIAACDPRPDPPVYRFDIVLQGERETVFFDFGAAGR